MAIATRRGAWQASIFLGQNTMHPAYIWTGLLMLLCSSFLDSLRGPLLPIFSQGLGLPYEKISLFLVAGYLTAMGFGRVLVAAIQRWSLYGVSAGACLIAPLAAVVAFQVSGLVSLVAFGIFLACASASVGALSNLFILRGTASGMRGRFYGLLHAMYGLGSLSAPLAVGFWVSQGWDWRGLLVCGAAPIACLGGWAWFGLKRVDEQTAESARPFRPFRWRSLQGLLVVAFALYVAAEVLGSMWMVTYLVEVRGWTIARAAAYATGFFVVLALTRSACALIRRDRDGLEKVLILGGLLLGLGFFVLGLSGQSWAFPCVGVVGPYFPLVLVRMSRYLPQEAPTLMLRVFLVMQGVLAGCHLAVGYFSTTLGVALAYRLPAAAYVLAIATTALYFRYEKRLL